MRDEHGKEVGLGAEVSRRFGTNREGEGLELFEAPKRVDWSVRVFSSCLLSWTHRG